MSAFRGQYTHQMDGKGRVSLPAAFRRGDVDRFVLVQLDGPQLTLFPEEKWREVEERLMDLGTRGRAEMNRVRMLFAGVHEVTLDRQGRILVPAPLQEAAGLDGAVLLLGLRDRVELWNPDAYRRDVEGAAADIDAFLPRILR